MYVYDGEQQQYNYPEIDWEELLNTMPDVHIDGYGEDGEIGFWVSTEETEKYLLNLAEEDGIEFFWGTLEDYDAYRRKLWYTYDSRPVGFMIWE